MEATDFSFSESDIPISGISLEKGDEVTMTVDVALSNGMGETLTVGNWTYQYGSLQ